MLARLALGMLALLFAAQPAAAAPVTKTAPYPGEVHSSYVTPSATFTGTGSASSTQDFVAGTVSVSVRAEDKTKAGTFVAGIGVGGMLASAAADLVAEFDGVTAGDNKYAITASFSVPLSGSGAPATAASVEQPVPLVTIPYASASAQTGAETIATVLVCSLSGCTLPADDPPAGQPTVQGSAFRTLRCAPSQVTCGNPGTFGLTAQVYVPPLGAGETARIYVQAGLNAAAAVTGNGVATASASATISSVVLSDPLGRR